MTVLSILLSSWSCKKYIRRIAIKQLYGSVKNLILGNDILSTLDPKLGRTLNKITAELVVSFYNSDEVSILIMGKNYCVTVRNEGPW